MISRWRIVSVISLCLVSTLACGFSTWVWSENNKADAGEIDVSVGNVTTNSEATIVFQKASLFTFGKYGFAHQETIRLNDEDQEITYFDYSYSISTIWKVSTKDTTSFTYQIGQTYNGSFNFLPKDNASMTVQSYSKYENEVLSDALSGASASYTSYTSGSITYSLTLPSSSSYQYVEMKYSNTATIESGKDFNTTVFTPATTQVDHNKTQVVTFSFILNKVGA